MLAPFRLSYVGGRVAAEEEERIGEGGEGWRMERTWLVRVLS